MQLATLPFFERLAPATTVLLAGAGGGFDVLAGLPIYFALRAKGVRVHLANLSFTRLDAVEGRRIAPSCVEVGPDSNGPSDYFPEKHLAAWLRQRGEDARVFAFDKTGVVPLKNAYEALASELACDTLVLVDGGSDSLLRGDEANLGTPAEDMASIAAADDLALRDKLLVSIGFGVDAFHGVCHAHVLENVAALIRDGGFLGAFSVLPAMPEFALYRAAVEHVHAAMPAQASIVNASILSAVEGDFGDVHRTDRTRGSKLWINPIMAMYFAVDLGVLARRVPYLHHLKSTRTMFEVSAVIEASQRELTTRPRAAIPV